MSNIYQESILNAMQIIAGDSVENSNATITIECEIAEIVDAGAGIYKVLYANNTFEALASSFVNYKVGDLVFVIVPDGDFSKTKSIIGPAESNEEAIADIDTEDIYINISDNLFGNLSDIELYTYHSEDREIPLPSDFITNLKRYLEKYKNFVLTMKVRTEMPVEQQSKGNYGVLLQIPIKADDGTGTIVSMTKDIKLDVNNMTGTPYNFISFANQELIEDLSNLNIDGTAHLHVFCENFSQVEQNTPESETPPPKPADIFIKDLSFNAADVLSDEDKNDYHLTLTATEGNFFFVGCLPSKIVTPVLKLKGKDKKIDGYACYQFIRDAAINTTSDRYTSIGGLGWRCMNQRILSDVSEEGKNIYQQVTNIYRFEVPQSLVKTSLEIRCILINGSTIINGYITLGAANPIYTCTLSSATGDTFFAKNLGMVSLIAQVKVPKVNFDNTHRIITKLQRYDKNNNYVETDQTYKRNNDYKEDNGNYIIESQIEFPSSLVDENNLIVCTFYDNYVNEDEDNIEVSDILATESLMIYASEVYEYKLVIINGDVLYKYDSDGDSPLVADYNGQNKITAINPMSYKIYKADGSEFTDEEYAYCKQKQVIPENSMLKPKSVDDDLKGKFLYYTIAPTFNMKKNENYVTLTVTFNDIELTETANVKFLKDGEMGTNGSKYAAVITQNDMPYGELKTGKKKSKLQFVYIDGSAPKWAFVDEYGTLIEVKNTNKDKRTLNIELYCDGKPITLDQANITYRMFDDMYINSCISVSKNENSTSAVVGIKEGGVLSAPTKEGETVVDIDGTCAIIEAEIKVSDSSSAELNHNEVLYVYYPIELTYIKSDNFDSIPSIDGGYTKVLFASDGTNPQYDNDNDFIFNTNYPINKETPDIYTYKQFKSGTNLNISGHNNEQSCKIIPVTKYDNGDSKNQIACLFTAKGGAWDTIDDEKDVLQEEVTYLNNLKSFYSNLQTEINAANSYLLTVKSQFESLKNNNMSTFLSHRESLTSYLENGLKVLVELANYCDKITKPEMPEEQGEQVRILKGNIDSLNQLKVDVQNFGIGVDQQSIGDMPTIIEPNKQDMKLTNAQYNKIMDFISNYNGFKNDFNDIKIIITEEIGDTVYNNFKTFVGNIYNYINAQGNVLDNIIYNSNFNFSYDLFKPIVTPKAEYQGLQDKLNSIYERFVNVVPNTGSSLEYIEEQLEKQEERAELGYTIGSSLNAIEDIFNTFYNTSNEYFIVNKYENEIGKIQEVINTLNEQIIEYEDLLGSYELQDVAYHIRPIIMVLNRYEMSNINSQDGNKLYIDDTNGTDPQYLLAPQVGAGIKENNQFTGIVMGIRGFNKSPNKKDIGLFGYAEGEQSLFLNAKDGSAIFGKSGSGQIIIDPKYDKGLLYSYDYQDPNDQGEDGKPIHYRKNPEGKGMLIDLTTPEIKFGSGRFEVNSNGELKAEGGGKIAGQDIGNIELSKNGLHLYAGDGNNDKPKIYSDTHNSLSNTYKGFYLGADGLSIGNSIRISSDDSTGIVEVGKISSSSKHQTISGGTTGVNDSYSYIAYGTTESKITTSGNVVSIDNTAGNEQVYIGTNGIRLGTKFAVDPNGNMLAKYITAAGGTIGGQSIGTSALSASGISIDSSGNISAGGSGSGTNGQSITSGGNAYFKNISCSGTFTITDGTNSQTSSDDGTNNSFSFSGKGTFFNTNGFTGGGAATYSSTEENPFGGTCVAHIGKLVADEISVIKITADQIAANAITSDKIAANAVTVGKIGPNAVTQTTIENGAITTDKLSANCITTDKLSSNCITANIIQAALTSPDQGSISVGTVTTSSLILYVHDGSGQQRKPVYYGITPPTGAQYLYIT